MRPLHPIVWILLCALVSAACGHPPAAAAPTPVIAPLPASPSPAGSLANWTGDAVVISRTGSAGCGWGTHEGAMRSGVLWRVTVTGSSIAMDEDMDNWPTDHISFSGTLSGTRFEATYDNGPDYQRWICQFTGASLSGRFSSDFSSFEAEETLVWGVPGAETVVRRHWVGRPR